MIKLDIARLENVSNVIINLIAALIIIIFTLIVANIVEKLIRKILHELELDKILKKQGITVPFEKFISSIVKYFIYFIGLIWALNQLGVATLILHIILIVVLTIFVAIIIIAFKDFIPNIIAGFIIHNKKIIKKNNIIQINKIQGKVLEIDILDTKIKTEDGDKMIIPNSMIVKNTIIIKDKKKI